MVSAYAPLQYIVYGKPTTSAPPRVPPPRHAGHSGGRKSSLPRAQRRSQLAARTHRARTLRLAESRGAESCGVLPDPQAADADRGSFQLERIVGPDGRAPHMRHRRAIESQALFGPAEMPAD